MTYLLHIDTSGEKGSVMLSHQSVLVACENNPAPMQHAAFLQPAVQRLVQKAGIALSQIAAISVSNGPGSYTGLRVGLASAKGLCFALDVPLITLNTLDIMAHAMHDDDTSGMSNSYCPMIDARRMEVYTALYNHELEMQMPPTALVLDEDSFVKSLQNTPVFFAGSGTAKWQNLVQHPNAVFVPLPDTAAAQARLGYEAFTNKQYAQWIHAEPFYLKAFYTKAKSNN